jgi:hypothetical protein
MRERRYVKREEEEQVITIEAAAWFEGFGYNAPPEGAR